MLDIFLLVNNQTDNEYPSFFMFKLAFAFVSSAESLMHVVVVLGVSGIKARPYGHTFIISFTWRGYPIGYLLSHADRRIYAVFTCGMRSRMASNRAMPMIVVRTPRVTSII